MKLSASSFGELQGQASPGSRRAFTLIECVVYIAVLFLLLGVAGAAFHSGMDRSFGLRRNAEDIAGALRVGEQWRADVRAATGPLLSGGSADEPVLRIPVHDGLVVYRIGDGALWRQTDADGPGTRLLARVKSSRMESAREGGIESWRWELELQSKEPVRMRPLFTFQAVSTKLN